MKKVQWLLVILLSLMLLWLGAVWLGNRGYGLTYQDSPSMPEGWFVYHPIRFPLTRGTVVVFHPAPHWQAYLVQQGWLLPHALMMKQVYALPGDVVCIKAQAVWVNQQRVAPILREYAPGKALPRLHLCRRLQAGEYMLMSTHILRSFDSRYFGPVQQGEIVGEVVD